MAINLMPNFHKLMDKLRKVLALNVHSGRFIESGRLDCEFSNRNFQLMRN